MYNSYTSLQREQLAKQTYTDTQSTYLLVYAPLRSRVLAQALQDQLHRKFRLVDHLAGELTDAVAGVLLVSEDVACLSTTLTYFAQALRDGADYAVCNAVFGFSGQTALYQSHGHLAENKFALVSRGLLARCRAAARDPESVTELLALAAQLCQAPVCIPQALLHYERDICAEDAYSASGKRAFVMSHVLDMTGAPIVLVSAVPVLRSMGYEVVVLGPDDSGSLQLFVDAGAAVITRAGLQHREELQMPFKRYQIQPVWRADPRYPRPEQRAGAGALVAPRCLCGLPPHRAPDPQAHCAQCAALLGRQTRCRRHALGPPPVRHPPPHLRPAGLCR